MLRLLYPFVWISSASANAIVRLWDGGAGTEA